MLEFESMLTIKENACVENVKIDLEGKKSLKSIFAIAKNAHEENKIIDLERKNALELSKLDEKHDLSLKIKTKDNVLDFNKDCYSQELLGLIKKYNFNIDFYEKFLDVDPYDYSPVYEVYYCSKNNWHFKVRNLGDCDIPEGIFALTDITNSITNEEVEFFCDLGCRNTGKILLETFLEFLEFNSLNDYVEFKYSHYLSLPYLLSKKGYEVKPYDFYFSLNEPNGYLDIGNNVYIKMYKGWYDDIKLVVTNDVTWNVNSSNYTIASTSCAYYFNYKSTEDIGDLENCIESFKSHMKGEIGYLMFGEYFNSKHIYAYFDQLRDSKDYFKDCWNHYNISIKHNNFWDGRGYYTNPLIPNKFTGLEIYTNTILKFNDAAQWSVGDNINISSITFIYDKRISNKCKLIIDNLICTQYDDCLVEFEELINDNEDIKMVVHSKHPKANRLEFEGSYLEMFEILHLYVTEMCEIHEIDL